MYHTEVERLVQIPYAHQSTLIISNSELTLFHQWTHPHPVTRLYESKSHIISSENIKTKVVKVSTKQFIRRDPTVKQKSSVGGHVNLTFASLTEY